MRSLSASFRDATTLLRLAALSCAAIMVGLFTFDTFRILNSLGIMALVIVALGYRFTQPAAGSRFPAAYYALMAIFGLNVLSGLQTETGNGAEFWRGLVLQLPFLALPLAFRWLPGLPGRYLVRLNLLLIGLVTLSALGSTGYYLMHLRQINQLYLQSQIMPTVPDHIRFSLMVTYAIAASVVLLGRNLLGAGRGWLFGALTFLVFYQHLLAVRSGLVTLYALTAVAVGWLLFTRRRKLAAYVLLALVVAPLLSFLAFPTFRNKFQNTREDMGRVEQTTSANNYSLVGRFYSYKVALSLAADHPLLGVGRANLRPAIARQYQREFPSISATSHILPHNQFLYYLVTYGGVGVLLFTICFYFPGVRIWPHYAPLLLAQYIIVTLSLLVEYTLEMQIGITYTLLLLLLALNGQEKPLQPESDWRLR